MTVTRRFGFGATSPFFAARHGPAPREDTFKSAAACGAVLVLGPGGGTRFGMGGGRSRCGPLSPSRPSRTCVLCHGRATRDPVGPSVAGRPRRGGPPAVVSELHSSGESGDEGRRRPRGSSDLRGQPEPASPSGHGRRARDGEVCRAAAVAAGLPSAPGSVRRMLPSRQQPVHSMSVHCSAHEKLSHTQL